MRQKRNCVFIVVNISFGFMCAYSVDQLALPGVAPKTPLSIINLLHAPPSQLALQRHQAQAFRYNSRNHKTYSVVPRLVYKHVCESFLYV